MVEEQSMRYWETIHDLFQGELCSATLTSDSPTFDSEGEMPWLKLNGTKLLDHQRRVFAKMLQMEQVQGIYIGRNRFNYKFGILCDVPLSGKSFMLLCMILYKPIIENECLLAGVQRFRDYYSMTVFADESMFDQLKTNLIICSSASIRRWEQLINTFVPDDRTVCIIYNTTDVLSFLANYVDKVHEFDILLVVDIASNQFIDGLRAHFIRPKFQRIIYDDADVIESGVDCPARFSWFATSRVKNLRWPTGRVYGTQQIDGLRLSRDLRRLFFSLENRPHSWFCNTVVKCFPALIEQSLGFEPVEVTEIKCFNTPVQELLQGVIPPESISALQNGDVETSIELIGCSIYPESENIVILLTRQMYRDIERNRADINSIMNELIHEDARDAKLKQCHDQIEDLQKKIGYIRDRVETTEICPISFDAIVNRAVIRCCGNVCDYESILQYLSSNQNNHREQTCPFCRHVIGPADIMVIGTCGNNSGRLPSRNQGLVQIFTQIFDRNPEARVLYVTSDYDSFNSQSSYRYYTELPENKTVFKKLPEGIIKISEDSDDNVWSRDEMFSMDCRGPANFRDGVDNVLITNTYAWRNKPDYMARVTDIVFSHPMDSEHEEDMIVRCQVSNKEILGENNNIEIQVWKIVY